MRPTNRLAPLSSPLSRSPPPAQQPRTYPTRDPHTPGYVRATELPDATLPPANKDGNFILGPTHPPAPEMTANPGVPQGAVTEITMTSADSKFYPGIARDPGTFGTPTPTTPSSSSSPPRILIPGPAPSPSTSRINMSPARPRPSSSEPTAPTAPSSPPSIT